MTRTPYTRRGAGLRARPSLRRAAAVAAVAATALAAGCGGGDDGGAEPEASGGGAAVNVKAFIFAPDPLEVEAGRTVTWTNEDSTLHTVTSGPRDRPDGRFDGDLPESGGEFSTTFDEPGTYEYFCEIHSGPGMEGTVVVK